MKRNSELKRVTFLDGILCERKKTYRKTTKKESLIKEARLYQKKFLSCKPWTSQD